MIQLQKYVKNTSVNVSHGGDQESLREVFSRRLMLPKDVTANRESQQSPRRSVKRYLNEGSSDRSEISSKRYNQRRHDEDVLLGDL